MPLAIKTYLTRILAIIITALMTTYGLNAQKKIQLSGYVLDHDGQPIEFANIKVVGKPIGASTDLKGFYKFSMISTKDSVSIEYSCLGFKSQIKKFPSLLTSQKINIKLQSQSTELAGVTVSAEKQKRTTSMQIIKTDLAKIAASPNAGVESLVGTYAGVSQNNELSSQYSVRGGSYDENMVYVNGIEIYRPLLVRTAEQEGLSFINPDLTSIVQFSAGGFTADYGDKISSVLDIKYKRPEHTEGSFSAGLLGGNAYIGSKIGKLSFIGGIRYKSGQTLLKNINDTDAEYDPHYVDAQTYLTYNISPRLKMSFLGNVSYTSYRFVPKTRETNFGTLENTKKFKIYFDGKEQDKFLTLFGALSLEHVPSAGSRRSLTFSFFKTREQETYDIDGSYFLNDLGAQNPSAMDALSGEGVLGLGNNHEHARNHLYASVFNTVFRQDHILNENHRLQYGLDYKLEKVDDYINEWEKRDSMGYTLPREKDLIAVWKNLYSDVSNSTSRFGGYIQDHIKIRTDKGLFTIIPGIRASYWTFNKELTISPRINGSFAPENNKNLVFRIAGGLYYQAPFYKELRNEVTDTDGNHRVFLNKGIKSQGAWTILLGTDIDFLVADRKFKFTSEVYYKYLFRINPYIRENVKIRYYGKNIGNGHVAGIDLKLFGEFVPGVDSWLTCSFLSSGQNLKDGLGHMPLMNAPKYNVSLFFQDYFPGFKRLSLSLRGVLSGGLPVMNPAKGFSKPAFTSTPYKRIDIGMQYTLFERSEDDYRTGFWSNFKKIAIGLDAFNLFDMANVNSYYWISDVFKQQYAVPNYLSRRQWNVRFSVDF